MNKVREREYGMESRLTLTLGHLYPDQLNLYGDRGNIVTLRRRCQLRGIELRVVGLFHRRQMRHALVGENRNERVVRIESRVERFDLVTPDRCARHQVHVGQDAAPQRNHVR